VPPLHCYIYFPCSTCTTPIITLEPCTLNAEFQNFILGFNKLPFFADTTERRDRRRKEAQRQGDFTDNSNNHIFTLNIFFGYGCVTDTYPCNRNMHKTCNSCYMFRVWGLCMKSSLHKLHETSAWNHLCMNCRQWNMSLNFNMGLLGFILLCCAADSLF
jgi:hypothetical protein